MPENGFSIRQVLRLGISLALMAGLLGAGTPARSTPLAVATITDNTSATAANDGAVNAGEYVGNTPGINSGFGDVIGATSRLYIDSSSSGGLNIGLVSGVTAIASTDAMVIYIDTDKGGAGFTTTSGFTDISDPCRRAISGYDGANRATLNFASGFKADYAICLEYTFAGVYRLVNGSSHTYVTSANRQNVTTRHYEMNLTLENLGLGPGSRFDYVATYLNQTNAWRSDEFQGVAAYGLGNPGRSAVNLAAGDFNTFISAPGTLSASAALGGDGPGGVGVTDGSSSLEVWLRGDRGAYTDTGCATAAANGNDVACWKDSNFTIGTLDNSNSPTAVHLATFWGEPFAGRATIHWQTLQESAILGFNLYRSTTPDGAWTKLNRALIPPKALGQPDGASYTFVDSGLTPGQVYYYWLEALNTDGLQRFDPAQVAGQFGVFLPVLKR